MRVPARPFCCCLARVSTMPRLASLIAEAGPLFAEAAFAAAQLGDSEEALTLASEGRARLMAVALKLQTLDLPAKKRQRLDELRTAIRAEQRAVEARKASSGRLQSRGSSDCGRSCSGSSRMPPQSESGARIGVGPGECCRRPGALSWCRSSPRWEPRLLSSRMRPLTLQSTVCRRALSPWLTVLDLPELTTDRLNVLLRGDSNKAGGWLGAYNINYLPEAEQDQRWPEWLAAVGDLGPELWRLFGARVDAALKERGIKTGARLIWLPTGALGILPLGLAQDPVTKRRLADDYEIVYAPSLEALATAQKQIAQPHNRYARCDHQPDRRPLRHREGRQARRLALPGQGTHGPGAVGGHA